MKKSYGALVGFSVNKEETIKSPPNSEGHTKITLQNLPRTVSGSSLNVVRILDSLGTAAKLLYTVGQDLHAHDVVEALTTWSIDGFPIRVRLRTPRTIVFIPNDNPKETKLYCHKPQYDEKLVKLVSHEVRQQVELCNPQYVVATGVRPDDLCLLQTLFEGPGKKVLNPSYELMKKYFSRVQVISNGLHLMAMNHEELCAGLGKSAEEFDPKVDINKFFNLMHTESMLITYNSNGSYYRSVHSKGLIHQPSLAQEVEDPTGAGDAFLGAFLHQQLSGESINDSLLFAAACAAAKIKKIGGSNVPTLAEITNCLDKTKQPTLLI